MKRVIIFAGLLAFLFTSLCESEAQDAFFDPVAQELEGWTIHVDPSLLEGGTHAEEGKRALRMLADHLHRITILVPDPRLDELRSLEIWIEHENPRLRAMQYHPSEGWLRANQHDPRLAKKVHIPVARNLLSRGQLLKHPMVVLHELAHAYHDQILSFDHPEVLAAYEAAKEKGIYENVLLYTNREVEHYGLSNHKEYFAECTEAYFGRNDFFPFVNAELENYDPQIWNLLRDIWGPVR